MSRWLKADTSRFAAPDVAVAFTDLVAQLPRVSDYEMFDAEMCRRVLLHDYKFSLFVHSLEKIAIFFRSIVQLEIRYLCIIYVLSTIIYLIYIIVYYTIFENTNKMSKYFSYENLDDICTAKVVYWLFCHNIIWILWKFNDVFRLRVRHIPVGSTSRLSRLDYLPRYRDEEK